LALGEGSHESNPGTLALFRVADLVADFLAANETVPRVDRYPIKTAYPPSPW